MSTGLIYSIDWRAVLALCGILGAVFLLIVWNHRGDARRGGLWLGHSALSLEVLGLALSLFWAARAPDGAILPIVFCVGWTGMVIGRAVLITYTVTAWQRRRFGVIFGAVGTLLIAYLALYGSGLFHAVNDAGDAAQVRLENSKPAIALDAEIEAARARLANLAGFADAGKAHAEEQAAAAAVQARADRVAQLEMELDATRAAAAPYANPDCTPKRDARGQPYTSKAAEFCGRIQVAQAALDRAGATTANGGGYAIRHAEYNGLQAHLVELQKQRAALSASGQGVVEAWKAEDRLLAWLFGITPEQASRVKWLVATAIFDILSLLFRIFSALTANRGDPETDKRRKLDSMLEGGFTLDEAIGIMLGGVAALPPPAQVSRPHQMESLDSGGRILSDGPFNGHQGEIVLNQPATEFVDRTYPGWLDDLNSGDRHEPTSALNDPVETDTFNEAVKRQQRVGGMDACAHCGKQYHVLTWNQKYCSEPCRIANWEQRTGAKLKKGRR